jgi:hypothetical protein
MLTVKQFVTQCYRTISASNPTIPLHGDDLSLGITILNQLLNSYASSGLLTTIATTYSIPLSIGQQDIVCGPSTYMPTPDIPLGRLSNLDSAWLLLDGVTYPLIDESRDVFLASWKYDPLQGLPRFIISFPDTEIVTLRLYPSPSQFFEFFIRAKFQLTNLTSASVLDGLPDYYMRFFLLAVARDLALYKSRTEAWTDKLEQRYQETLKDIIAASEVNVSITGDRESLLNGSWRVKAGI